MDAISLSLLFILNPQMFNGPKGLDDVLFMIQLSCQIHNDLAKQNQWPKNTGNAAIAIEAVKVELNEGCTSDINRK